MNAERWRPVVGYEGIYEVSDRGRVKSLKPTVPLILKHNVQKKSGHHQVSLYNRGRATPLVHWLVLEAFVGPRPEGLWGLHGNDDRDDNRLGNLRWDYPSANATDRVRNGKQARGSKSGKSKLTPQKVRLACSLVKGGQSHRSVAKVVGVAPQSIDAIMSGRTWVHVTGFRKAGAA